MYEKLPETLKSGAGFLLWRYETRNGRPTKVPYRISGVRADATNRSHFSAFEAVKLAFDKGGYDGIGMVSVLKDTSEFDAEIAKLESEMDEIGVLTESLIGRNPSVAISQDEYNRQYDAHTERFNKAKSKCDKLKGRKVSVLLRRRTECFIWR